MVRSDLQAVRSTVPTWAKLRVLHVINSTPGITANSIWMALSDVGQVVTTQAILELLEQESIRHQLEGPDAVLHYYVTDYGKSDIVNDRSHSDWVFWTIVGICGIVLAAIIKTFLDIRATP